MRGSGFRHRAARCAGERRGPSHWQALQTKGEVQQAVWAWFSVTCSVELGKPKGVVVRGGS